MNEVGSYGWTIKVKKHIAGHNGQYTGDSLLHVNIRRVEDAVLSQVNKYHFYVFYVTQHADCFSLISHNFAGSRIGNLLVPNDNYCKFEEWLMPILDQMVVEQNTEVESFPNFLNIFGCLQPSLEESLTVFCCSLVTWCLFLQGTRWTPSKMIHRLGKEINNPDSVYYWAYKVSDLKCLTRR